ncbi:hypothetical protein PI125_g21340 [Phytophthora idaei]|nr:hypothetical protein PI125_g21340 [Phytophthora idaei]
MEGCIQILYNRLPRDVCSGVFCVVHGRPCLHDQIKIIESSSRLRLMSQDFSKHWWINRFICGNQIRRVLDPAPMGAVRRRSSRRGSHRANAGVNGARREPTYTERMDLSHLSTPPSVDPRSSRDGNVVVLPPVGGIETAAVTDDATPYQEHYVPPRPWMYAGWSV